MPMLEKYFDEQKEFIKCQEGCANCCSQGNYPVTELEYSYMLLAYNELPESQKEEILQKTMDILKRRQKFIQTNDIKEFRYKCPFLKDNKCSIYNNRALVCRIHGLIIKDTEDGAPGIPHCVKDGLNFSNACDENFKILTEDVLQSKGFEKRPIAYNISYGTLIKLEESIDFGDVRMMAEWVIISQPNADELIEKIKNSVN